MATITITDEGGKELLTSQLPPSGFGRYFKAAASLRSTVATAMALSKPLADADGARTLGLALDRDIPLGADGELSIGGGANVGIAVHEPGGKIFAGSDLEAPVTVPHGTSYTSVTLEALLKAGVSGNAGAIGTGFQSGTALRYAYFHPFDVVAPSPTVGEAIRTMFGAAVFPADADDLAAMAVGGFASVAGEGEISFSGTASLGSSTNLLATPGLPILGTVALTQGATVAVKAGWTASGGVELRVARPDASHAVLSFYRRKGQSLTVSARAMAGVSVMVRRKELLGALMTAISPNPEADLEALVNGGLDDETIEGIQEAVAASVDRSLTLATQLQISGSRDDEALFAYEVDLGRIGEADKAVIRDALHGRLTAIDALAAAPGAPVRAITSALGQLRQRKGSWRINLLGILNVASFVELVRQGTMTFDPVSGALTAADKVSARRIRVASRPLESDTEKLRRVLLESLMVTAAYQASRVLGSTVTLTGEQIYVEQHSRTKRHELDEHYRALIALGLCTEAERDARLGTQSEFGHSTLTIQNRFDPVACDAMFITADGKPRAVADYERLGRNALLALMPANDPSRAFRRPTLQVDQLWAKVRELGGAIDEALPVQVRQDPLRRTLVRADVFTIVWWANAMNKAARELIAMRSFLAQRDASTLFESADFATARNRLSEALGSVVATADALFDDPWDILAMDAAAARQGKLEAVVISPRFAAQYSDAAPSLPAPAPPSRAARNPDVAARFGDTHRDWTDEERGVFSRHVINLRGGKLSNDGSFRSSVEQVHRIFTDHIPAYARQQRAVGQQPRVLFFAHGGLVEEREGLLGVLARRRVWEQNGIYPVCFVWETGLLETLGGIIRQAVPGRGERGALTDEAIERGARPGGKAIWDQMKSAAKKGVASDGGAALAARFAGELWKAMAGDIEFHALGHSAGAIFHAHFLPALIGQRPDGVPPVDVRTLHLLAPAISTDLFKSRLKPLVGPGQPITRLTTYTMDDEHERGDSSIHPYGKSLLYLVSEAFDDSQPTPILGLQRSLKRDLALIRFFGMAGTEKVADITFSTSPEGTPRNARTTSITHGGFDNDVATMTSVIRRVLDVPDSAEVVEYFEESVPGFRPRPTSR